MVYCRNCGEPLPEGALYCPKCGATVTTQETSTTPPPSQTTYQSPIAPGLKLATWGERFVAWLIDVIIVGVFVALLGAVVSLAWSPFGIPAWSPFNLGSSGLIYFLYWLITEGAYGQSLGKMIMHLRVTRLNGSPINMGQAAIESIGKSFLSPLLLLIDFVLGLVLYPNRKQRLFNYVSETVVIHE